jgi:hypothetical protein
MKRKLLTLLITLMILASVAWMPPTAECFGCTADDKRECLRRAVQELNDCWNFYGDTMGSIICPGEYQRNYETCLMTKGCPIPPANP